jgi:hypothetical protein
MSFKHFGVVSLFRLAARVSTSARCEPPTRRRPRLRPWPEALESRWALDGSITTYTWTALGDKTSFNDPNNWSHFGQLGGVGIPGVPTIGSNISFPPISWLPANSPTTINFNVGGPGFPVNLFEIGDSYTFTGSGVNASGGIIVANPGFGPSTNASILLSSVQLGRGATIYTQDKSTLTIGSATNPTGLQLILVDGVTKGGGGELALETQSIFDPMFGINLQTFEVAGGTVILGTTMDFSNSLFQVDSGATLNASDGAAVKAGSLSGAGAVDLLGTGASGDQTGLTVFTPVGESDTFTGPIDGHGHLTMQGHGTLAIGGIDFGTAGAVKVVSGTLDVNGPIVATTLNASGGRFGGLGSWVFSGPVAFQSGSAFDVTLDGLSPGTQYTQLAGADATNGINLGNSTLAATVGYEYQTGDRFTIVSAPLVQGTFQNVVNGMVLLGGDIPFSVAYSGTSVTLTALQSESTTQLSSSGNPSHPGQTVTFTARIGTRTAPVTGGSVTFAMGGTVLASVPVASDGTASFTTTSLPLGTSTVTATFGGVSNILGSTSAPLSQTVVPYSTVTIVSSSANPSRFRQAVTLTATVTADGMPVTSGVVIFTRGSQLIGTAALGPDGTASLITSALPRGTIRIQAAFGGNAEDLGSVSQAYFQNVDRAGTTTTLISTTPPINGRSREVLVASVDTVGVTGIAPAGSVVFRRHGRVIRRVTLFAGSASLVLPRRFHGRGVFVAWFQGNPRFAGSTSAPVILRS